MTKALFLAMAFLALGFASAAEDVSEQAKAFLEKNGIKEDDRNKWTAARLRDSMSGEEHDQAYVLDRLKDWISCSLRNKFDEKDKRPTIQRLSLTEKIELCEWYLLFHGKGWALPQAAPYDDFDKCITLANFKDYVDPQAQAVQVVQDAE